MDVADYRFCPLCGRTPLTTECGGRAKRCPQCRRTFHSAPHAAVGALIVDEEECHVLLTRRDVEPFKDVWDLPGGFVEIGESLEDGLRREVREDLGIEIRIRAFSGSYPDVYGADATPVVAAVYVATIARGFPSPGAEVAEFQWFRKDGLPPLAFENCRRALAAWRGERAEAEPRDRDVSPAEPRQPDAGSPTILVIEDDDEVRDLILEILTDDGYRVLAASQPTEAFDLAEQHPGRIDLLVTDVILPGMNGRAAAQRIRTMYPDVKILFISGYPEHEIEHHGVHRSGVPFLGKPFPLPALRLKVRELLADS